MRLRTNRAMARWAVLLLVGSLGCGDARPEPAEQSEPTSIHEGYGTEFNAATAGTIRGRVTWQGELPTVPRFHTSPILPGGIVLSEGLDRENPNAPLVDPKTRGVANAVVFLRGIDPQRARPWNLPPVCVEMRDYRFLVRQGETASLVGFIRRGERVAMVSRQSVFHLLHAEGAAFFGLTFPDPDRPRNRRVDQLGVVELASAAGYYWMRAYLFVDDHPYYARTDADGRFTLPQVPPGEYETVCWVPNWHEARHDRDPETGVYLRLFFKPAVEHVKRATVGRNETCEIDFAFAADEF